VFNTTWIIRTFVFCTLLLRIFSFLYILIRFSVLPPSNPPPAASQSTVIDPSHPTLCSGRFSLSLHVRLPTGNAAVVVFPFSPFLRLLWPWFGNFLMSLIVLNWLILLWNYDYK
jgi:hypothetical protein